MAVVRGWDVQVAIHLHMFKTTRFQTWYVIEETIVYKRSPFSPLHCFQSCATL